MAAVAVGLGLLAALMEVGDVEVLLRALADHLALVPADRGPRDERAGGVEEPYQLIPYGSETIDRVDVFSTPCHRCDAAPGARHKRHCSNFPAGTRAE